MENLKTIIYYKVEDQTQLPYTQIFVSSKRLSAEEEIQIIQEHWGIEENHHILEVVMKEDHHQAHKDNAALVLAIMKQLGLNKLLRSRRKESISGAINYSHSCIWNLFVQLTHFQLKYPQYAKYFDFNK